VRPHNEKLTRLTELRGRTQGANEPLRQFLVEVGSKLKSIGYDRDLWLDLIFPALRSELQAAISSFGSEGINSFDSLLENSEKMERIASALERKQFNPIFNSVYTNTILQDKSPTDTQTDTTFQNKLTTIEQTLAQIASLENKRQERREKRRNDGRRSKSESRDVGRKVENVDEVDFNVERVNDRYTRREVNNNARRDD
jgi:hypothetical protein